MNELRLPAEFSDVSLKELMVVEQNKSIEEVLATWTGTSTTDIRKLPSSVAQRAIQHIESVLSRAQPRFSARVTIDGKEYGFIPDWEEFTTGEYIDMESCSEDVYANALKICSILYRPITSSYKDKYEIEKYTAKEDESVFEELPAENFLGILSFFLTTRDRLLRDMQFYLKGVMAETTNSLRNGDGTEFSTSYRGKNSFVWIASRNFLSKLYSSISHS